MLRQFSTRRIVVFFLADWIGTACMLLAAGLLHDMLLPHAPWRPVWPGQSTGLIDASGSGSASNATPFLIVAMVMTIWPVLFSAFSLYDGRRNGSLKRELANILLAICLSTIALAGILYFTYRETPRTLIALFFLLDSALLCSSRIALWVYRRWQNKFRRGPPRGVIVVGADQMGQQAARQLVKCAWANIRLLGYVDDDPSKQNKSLDNLPVLGTPDDLPTLVAALGIQAGVVALPLDAHERLVQTCRLLQSMGVRVYVIPDLFALSFPHAALDGFGGIPVIDLGARGINGMPRFVKRVFDITAVTIGLVLISPLLLLLAIVIKLDSPGPALYLQDRIGENGLPFKMFKFRSMRADTDPAIHRAYMTHLIRENLRLEDIHGNRKPSLKIANDPRVTRVGNFIRKTSLDELPQLLNVLRGEMSLVGPRPPLPYEVELYEDWHKRRLEGIPGITGLWQVRGRNQVCFDEMVRMDLEYIEHQSLWLDLKLLIQTPLAVLSGKGAG